MQTHAYIIGKAAEYRIASELILRGIAPCFPAVDDGVDLTTSSGIRLQIKATSCTFSSGAASFTLCARKKDGKSGWRKFSSECDFLVLWHIPTNRFWVAPSALFDGYTRCVVGTQTRRAKWTTETRQEALRLKADGLSQNEIAAKLGQGLSRFNVRHMLSNENYAKRLSGRGRAGESITLAEQVERYENCWNLLRPESFADATAESLMEATHAE